MKERRIFTIIPSLILSGLLFTSCATSSDNSTQSTTESTTTQSEESITTTTAPIPPNNRGVLGDYSTKTFPLTEEEIEACAVDSTVYSYCWDVYNAMVEISQNISKPEEMKLIASFDHREYGEESQVSNGQWLKVSTSNGTHVYVIRDKGMHGVFGYYNPSTLDKDDEYYEEFEVFDYQERYDKTADLSWDIFYDNAKEDGRILTNKDIAAINKAYQYYCEEMGWL